MDYFRAGGLTMYPMLFLSVISLAVIIERFFTLRRAHVNVGEFLQKIRRALVVNRSLNEAVKTCEQSRGPIASIVKAGLRKYGQPQEEIEKTIENAATFEMGRLERWLPILATTANIGPLLGFLGTVTGMIKSFDALSKAGLSNPGLVARGIMEALITTAFGLFIAIPVQLAYNYFVSRINKYVRDIETSANMLLETFGEMEKSGIQPEGVSTAPISSGLAKQGTK